MDNTTRTFRQLTAERIIKNLNKRGMNGVYHHTGSEAKAAVLDMIPSPSTVIRCGSESVAQLDLWNAIAAKPGVELISPYEPGLPPDETLARRNRGLTADVQVTSANAMTQDGVLVNLDSTGNRVSAMFFGPKKVIVLVGMNKVVSTVEAAMDRVRTLAAPVNCLRRSEVKSGPKPPCCQDGLCHQCFSPNKICNMWSIIEGQKFKDRLHVVLVEDDLGY